MHHRKRNRLHGYDYSNDALYFVTSCVQDRINCFGEIIMDGSYCRDGSRPVPTIRSVPTSRDTDRSRPVPTMQLNIFGNIAKRQWYWLAEQYLYVQLHAFVVMPNHIHGILEINRNFSVQKIKSLSELMGAYKTTSSKQMRLAGMGEFAWQRSFHDHIIRDQASFNRIEKYILNNPSKWQEDMFHANQ